MVGGVVSVGGMEVGCEDEGCEDVGCEDEGCEDVGCEDDGCDDAGVEVSLGSPQLPTNNTSNKASIRGNNQIFFIANYYLLCILLSTWPCFIGSSITPFDIESFFNFIRTIIRNSLSTEDISQLLPYES